MAGRRRGSWPSSTSATASPDEARRYRETAYRLWLKISPIPHVVPGEIETYGGQPNKQAADMVTTFDPGRMIWNGYTGAAGWMFRQALEGVLGFRLEAGRDGPPRRPRAGRRAGIVRVSRDTRGSPLPASRRAPSPRAAGRRRTANAAELTAASASHQITRLIRRRNHPDEPVIRPWPRRLGGLNLHSREHPGREAVAAPATPPTSRFPTVPPSTGTSAQLLDNAMRYVAPENRMVDPVSGYPFEGWNQDPKRGLFLRSFTQLTAIGQWMELLANIVAGQADTPCLSREQALDQPDSPGPEPPRRPARPSPQRQGTAGQLPRPRHRQAARPARLRRR